MAALQPLTVIPGHSAAGAKRGASQIAWSQSYLARYEQEPPRAADSGALIGAMKQDDPEAGLGIALDVGAKHLRRPAPLDSRRAERSAGGESVKVAGIAEVRKARTAARNIRNAEAGA